jgi:hypothetical protein
MAPCRHRTPARPRECRPTPPPPHRQRPHRRHHRHPPLPPRTTPTGTSSAAASRTRVLPSSPSPRSFSSYAPRRLHGSPLARFHPQQRRAGIVERAKLSLQTLTHEVKSKNQEREQSTTRRLGNTHQVNEAGVRPHRRMTLDRKGHVRLFQHHPDALLDLQISEKALGRRRTLQPHSRRHPE